MQQFVSYDTKSTITTKKMDKFYFVKVENICSQRMPSVKWKRQWTELKKMLANNISDKGLVSRIYKEILQLNNKNTNNPIKNKPRVELVIFWRRYTDG